jgi:hypothetical protein
MALMDDPRRRSLALGEDSARQLASALGTDASAIDAGGTVVSVRSDNDNRRDFHVSSGGPAVLLVRIANFPGWTATVNRTPVATYRALEALIAIPVPAGESTVVLRFRPTTFAVSLALAYMMFILACGLAAWFSLRRSAAVSSRWQRTPDSIAA